jgi:cytochrome P450
VRPRIDFDHHSAAYANSWPEVAREFHASGTPLAWTEHHGGFWVLADHASIQIVASDWATFTSENDLTGTGNGGRGQIIPQMPYRLFLGESDPPHHTDRRSIEAPYFAPKMLRRWRPVAQHFLNEAIDQVVERGHADLIDDIILPTTARTTLHVLGWDTDNWRDAAAAAHRGAFLLHTDPAYPHAEQERMRKQFRAMVVERRERPSDDLISRIARGTVQGEPLNLDEAESMVNALVFGGFDTTTSLMAHAMVFLDSNPAVAERFRDDSTCRRNAVEELLRLNPPATGMCRTATRDTMLLGQQIRKGERVYMWFAGANRDPSVFVEPDVFDIDRSNARDHLAFSTGHHRCLGSPLAKIEIEEMLTIIPQRLAALKVNQQAHRTYPDIGNVNGYSTIPVTFEPGPRLESRPPEAIATPRKTD